MVSEPFACIGRECDGIPWGVVVALPRQSVGLTVDDAKSFVLQINKEIETAEAANRSGLWQGLRLIQGEGSNLRDDAPTERHLRSV